MRKSQDIDILSEIEKDFIEEERADTVDDEIDATGLKRWEVEFLHKGRMN